MTQDVKLGYMDKLRLFKKDARLWIASNALSAFAFGVSNVVFNLYMVAIPGFEEDFLGLFLSVSMFATAAIAIIAGMVTDRSSRKRIILSQSFLGLGMIAVQYTVTDPIPLMMSQVILGLTSAFGQVAWAPYITDLSTSEERAHLFGFNGGISLLAVLAGNVLGGFLPGFFQTYLSLGPNLLWPYRLTLWFSLVPMLVSTLLLVPMSSDRPRDCEVKMGFQNVKNWRFIGGYMASVSTIGLGAGMIVMYFNLFFESVFEADAALIGIIFGINTITLSAGNFLSPALSDRIGKVKTIILTEALSIPFLLMISWAPVIYFAVIAYVMRSVLMNMAGPVQSAFFMEGLRKEERATAMGVVRTGDSLARGVAANIGGWMLAAGLYREPYLLVSGLYIVGIFMFYYFFKGKEEELKRLQEAEVIIEQRPEEELDVT
ncbi:MAG: MFS transporter [Candidatus Thorarchaeota archaeon]|jgi:MFS family permease